MPAVGKKITPSTPSLDELVSRAAKIGSLVRELAERTEANRMVSTEAISEMRDAGLFRIMQPAVYGGYEYGFEALIPVVAAVGAGCGSSAWVFSQWPINGSSPRIPGKRRTNVIRIPTPSRPDRMHPWARSWSSVAAIAYQDRGVSRVAAIMHNGLFSAA